VTAREAVQAIWRAALDAAAVEPLIRRTLGLNGDTLSCGAATVDLRGVARVLVLGCGKAGAAMARAVEAVLGSLDLERTPRLLVFNKMDRAPEVARSLAHREGGVAVSAETRGGFPELLARCEEILWRRGRVMAPGAEPEFVRPRHG
jgi:hypothetical protein